MGLTRLRQYLGQVVRQRGMAETRRAHLKLDSAVDAGLNGTITLHLPMVVIASLYGEKNSN